MHSAIAAWQRCMSAGTSSAVIPAVGIGGRARITTAGRPAEEDLRMLRDLG